MKNIVVRIVRGMNITTLYKGDDSDAACVIYIAIRYACDKWAGDEQRQEVGKHHVDYFDMPNGRCEIEYDLE